MAAIEWGKVEGFEFTGPEAREASDFDEILRNHELEYDCAFDMFKCEDLKLGQRLLFAAKASADKIAFMLFREPDVRLCGVIKRRLENGRIKDAGGIVC